VKTLNVVKDVSVDKQTQEYVCKYNDINIYYFKFNKKYICVCVKCNLYRCVCYKRVVQKQVSIIKV